jgi:hypothetical protein
MFGETRSMTTRETHKVLNQTMLVMGIAQGLFYAVLFGAVFAYMASGRRWKLGIAVLLVGELLAFFMTRKYGSNPIAVWSTMRRIKHRYDASKHEAFEVRITR